MTRPAGAKELTEQRNLRTVFVQFVWLLIVLLFALTSVPVGSRAATGKLMVYGTFAMGAIGLAGYILRGMKNTAQYASVLSYLCMLILPGIAGEDLSIEIPSYSLLVNLYFVVLVSVPVFFNIWTWQIQAFIAITTLIIVNLGSVVNSPGLEGAILPFACLLTVFVAYVREQHVNQSSVSCFWRDAKREPEVVKEAAWQVLLLQSGFVLSLLFMSFNEETAGGVPGYDLLLPIYAFIVLVLGALPLSVAKGAGLEAGLLLITIVVGTLLASSGDYQAGHGWIYQNVSVVYLSISVIGLRWSVGKQLTLVWSLISVLVFVQFASSLKAGHDWGEYFALGVLNSQGQWMLTIMGLVLSIAFLGFLQPRSLGMKRVVEKTDKEPDTDNATLVLANHKHELLSSIDRALFGQMLYGLFGLGLSSLIFTSIILLSRDTHPYMRCLGVWGGFVCMWMLCRTVVMQCHRKDIVWFVGVMSVFLCVIVPLVATSVFGGDDGTLAIWPLCLLTGIGLIPWPVTQLLVITIVAVSAGVEIATLHAWNVELVVLFIIVSLGSASLSRVLSRRIIYSTVLSSYLDKLEDSFGFSHLYNLLICHLDSLISDVVAVITDRRDSLVLVGGDERGKEAVMIGNLRAWAKREAGFEKSNSLWALKSVHRWPELLTACFPSITKKTGLRTSLIAVRPNIGVDAEVSDREIYILFAQPNSEYDVMLSGVRTVLETMVQLTMLKCQNIWSEEYCVRQEGLALKERTARDYELGVLVHDINNTVQDLTVYCDSVQEQLDCPKKANDPEEWRKDVNRAIRRIAVTARTMAMTVSDAKRRREIDTKVELSPCEVVNVAEVIDETYCFAQIRAERKGMLINRSFTLCEGESEELIYSLDIQNLWVRVSAREHLEAVLRNLYDNAIKYSNPGGEIEQRVIATEGEVIIEIEDHGSGLSSDECEKIFTVGYRGSAGKLISGGLGLGLSHSVQIVEAAGGSLSALSPGEGAGSIFRVSLPRFSSMNVGKTSDPWALLVDDQPNLTEFYGRIVCALHFTPQIAHSASEALNRVRELGCPGLVLTDLHLGNSNGIDIIKYIRKEFGSSVPIIVVSALDDENTQRKIGEAGASLFIAKPVTRRALFARIEGIINKWDVGV